VPLWIVIDLPPARHRTVKLLFKVMLGRLAQATLKSLFLLLQLPDLGTQRSGRHVSRNRSTHRT
jgi:hypothetical protein